jgi:CRISPR-associated helicase Cas3
MVQTHTVSAPQGNFQDAVHRLSSGGESLLLIAPTGLGKTRAVCGDLRDARRKTVYAVPLRALGAGIKQELSGEAYRRNGQNLSPVTHHGGTQESNLFSEEVIVTTYDQVVCGVPGLPLSLPLKSGHAVAGALLMSRLVLDEAHLAWGISREALPILLAIIDFRLRLGLQTVVLTATLPEAVAIQLQKHFEQLGLEFTPLIVGQGDLADDERLKARERNRQVGVSSIPLRNKKSSAGQQKKEFDWTPVDTALTAASGKRIYFANTVERLQSTYDRLVNDGLNPDSIAVLHNRMPRRWREDAERLVLNERFGKGCPDGDWVLLTNQVAEAGLDISAPLVVSDPAPVDTLVQRAGRCARWFDEGPVKGKFLIVVPPKAQLGEVAAPYRRTDFVEAALESAPPRLNWESELQWVNKAWGGGPKKAGKAVEDALNQTAFALNLFDRASQNHDPGAIANVFREIVSVEIAIDPTCDQSELQRRVDSRQRPQTSTVSLGQATRLAHGQAKVVRYEDGDLRVADADRVELGDILIVPPTVAYLNQAKGLCLGDGTEDSNPAAIFASEWESAASIGKTLPLEGGKPQKLLEHLQGVMQRVRRRFADSGDYRRTLKNILTALEPRKDAEALVNAVAGIATLAAGFHDLGKADVTWQKRARAIDPSSGPELIGRTAVTGKRIGRPHSPPAFHAIVKACELLLGELGTANHLVRAIALAAARHHSSFVNPALVRVQRDAQYRFSAHPDAGGLVQAILLEANAPRSVVERAREIISAAEAVPEQSEIPLALPNDDLFPIYALVGRAILMADREDASDASLENWRQ